MYKVMVVDDEELVRAGLIHRLNNIDLPVMFCAQADSGEEALVLAKKEYPDILLVDIRLSGMSGLEFIRKMKKINSRVQFIIISGYADFEYAKTAISLEVIDYITKPVDKTAFFKALSSAVAKIRIQHNYHIDISGKDPDLNSMEISFNRLLHSPIKRNSCSVKLKERLEGKYKAMMMVHMENVNDFPVKNRQAAGEIEETVRKAEGPDFELFTFRDYQTDNQLIIIMNYLAGNPIYGGISGFASELHRKLKQEGSVPLTMAVGAGFYGLEESRAQYHQLQTLLLRRYLSGGGGFFTLADTAKSNDRAVYFPHERINRLRECVLSGDIDKTREMLHDIFKKERLENFSEFSIEKLYYSIAGMIGKIEFEYDDVEKTRIQNDFVKEYSVHRFDGIGELVETLVTFAGEKMRLARREFTGSDYKMLICKIKKHIDDFYYEEISRESFSKKYNISESYFSKLFKMYTGSNFTSYLNRVRMEHAAKYLEQTNMSVMEIALSCGFNSHTYFCRLFKRMYHLSPKEYKEALIGKEQAF